MRASEAEPRLRMATTGIRNAQNSLRCLYAGPDDLEIRDAIEVMDEAVYWIEQWATRNELVIMESMPT